MRVRTGFVSNSSSTSFLIITRDELEEGAFLELMGVAPDSPIAGLFQELFRDVVRSSRYVDFERVNTRVSPEALFDTDRLSQTMITRLQQAASQGLKAYFGKLSSDNTQCSRSSVRTPSNSRTSGSTSTTWSVPGDAAAGRHDSQAVPEAAVHRDVQPSLWILCPC